MKMQSLFWLFLFPLFLPLSAAAQRTALEGSGNLVTVATPALANFSQLRLDGLVADIEVEVGPAAALSIRADDNLAPLMKVSLDGATLSITIPKNHNNALWIESSNTIIKLSTPVLTNLDLNYNGKCRVSGLDNDSLVVRKESNGDLWLQGNVQYLDLYRESNGHVFAEDLTATRADVTSRGNGDAKVKVLETLNAQRSGNGDIINHAGARLNKMEDEGNGDIYNVAERNAPPPATFVSVTLVNNTEKWRSFGVKGPQSAKFSYGFDMEAGEQRKERWPAGSKVLDKKGNVLVEITAAQDGQVVPLYRKN